MTLNLSWAAARAGTRGGGCDGKFGVVTPF